MTQDITRELVKDVVAKEVHRQTAIAELESAANRWEQQVHDGTYSLAKDLRDYLTSKAASARREAGRLRGEDVPAPEPRVVTKTVVVSR